MLFTHHINVLFQFSQYLGITSKEELWQFLKCFFSSLLMEMYKILGTVGLTLLAISLLMYFFEHSVFGKLPGDIIWKDKDGNITFHFPLTTCIIFSLIISFASGFLYKP